MNRQAASVAGANQAYIDQECEYQLDEIARPQKLVRAVSPQVTGKVRSVILTDDSVATGSTMSAARPIIDRRTPDEMIVAVPVAPADRLEFTRGPCDHPICVLSPEDFAAVGPFCRDFLRVDYIKIVHILRKSAGPQARIRNEQCATLGNKCNSVRDGSCAVK